MPDRIENILERLGTINEEVGNLKKLFEDMQEQLAYQERLVSRLQAKTGKIAIEDATEKPKRVTRRHVARASNK